VTIFDRMLNNSPYAIVMSIATGIVAAIGSTVLVLAGGPGDPAFVALGACFLSYFMWRKRLQPMNLPSNATWGEYEAARKDIRAPRP
jgi:hypothetical protein